jgi:DUF4097 and DUF4098 domain-containing protein YvlB
MRRALVAGLLTFAALAAAEPVAAQKEDFTWGGKLAAGKSIEIKGINGDVHAVAATGSEVSVTARKRARKSDPEDVKIEVIQHADGVTICAVYPTPDDARHQNECKAGDGGHMSTRNNDVRVDFTVHVPSGVEFVGRTVNGDVDAERLASNVDASTVNGSIAVSTSGFANASTVNGSINARMGTATWPESVEFRTVNGGITIDVPQNLNADVRFSTVNGDIDSDFDVTVRGRLSQRRMRGTIGSGGRDIFAETVNGSIRLRRGT